MTSSTVEPNRESDARRKTVVFVAFQIFGLANGGVESATTILEALSDYRRIVVTQAETRFCERWRKMGCEVEVWPTSYEQPTSTLGRLRYRAQRATSILEFNRRIFALLGRTPVDVVHANDIGAFWHAAMGAKMRRTPVSFSVRSVFPPQDAYGLKWSTVHHLADQVVCLSEDLRDAALHRFGPPGPWPLPKASTSVIYTGLDLQRLRPAEPQARMELRRSLGVGNEDVIIGHVAKVWPVKNQLGVLEHVAPELFRRVPNAQLWFVGDYDAKADPYAQACLEAARPFGDKVRWIGFVEDPLRFYQAFDVSLLASQYEGLARCLIESLACGLPVVSFAVPSAREVLEPDDCGRVVAQGDNRAFVDALVSYVQDPIARSAAGLRGRRTAERLFDARVAAQAYRDLYDWLAARRKTSRGELS
jgi:glycosyltransferase involved in cell wall biosynthesis